MATYAFESDIGRKLAIKDGSILLPSKFDQKAPSFLTDVTPLAFGDLLCGKIELVIKATFEGEGVIKSNFHRNILARVSFCKLLGNHFGFFLLISLESAFGRVLLLSSSTCIRIQSLLKHARARLLSSRLHVGSIRLLIVHCV